MLDSVEFSIPVPLEPCLPQMNQFVRIAGTLPSLAILSIGCDEVGLAHANARTCPTVPYAASDVTDQNRKKTTRSRCQYARERTVRFACFNDVLVEGHCFDSAQLRLSALPSTHP